MEHPKAFCLQLHEVNTSALGFLMMRVLEHFLSILYRGIRVLEPFFQQFFLYSTDKKVVQFPLVAKKIILMPQGVIEVDPHHLGVIGPSKVKARPCLLYINHQVKALTQQRTKAPVKS